MTLPRTYTLFALLLWLHAGFAHAQVLDCTVSGELADVGAKRLAFVIPHAWNLGDAGHIPRAVWQPGFDAAEKGEDVAIDCEPPHVLNKDWVRPTDPSLAKLSEIKATHALFAEQLEPLCRLARKRGAAVWIYGDFLCPTHTRGEQIVADASVWNEDVRTLCTLKFDPKRPTVTIASLLESTGGGALFPVYLTDSHNREEGWAIAKCFARYERQYDTLTENGVRCIPLFNLNTLGIKPVRRQTMEALIFFAKRRGTIAVWNGYGGGPGFVKLTDEQKGWLK